MELPVDFEAIFLVKLFFAVILGAIIGAERESRKKDAGISTNVFVTAGALLFTVISANVDPNSTSRIAAQVVTGIGFLGAGLIIKEGKVVKNLTTAASLWYSAGIGMALGYGFYGVALVATIFSIIIPRLPRVPQNEEAINGEDTPKRKRKRTR